MLGGGQTVMAAQDTRTHLAEAVHPTVIAYAHYPVFVDQRLVRRIVHDDVGRCALYYMDWDVVRPRECGDLWLPAPDRCISYFCTVVFELFWGHQAAV